MSSYASLAKTYCISLSENRSAVEKVIENLSRMGRVALMQAVERLSGGVGRGFYYDEDPTLSPPRSYAELSVSLARPAGSGESGSESLSTSTPLPQGSFRVPGLQGQSFGLQGQYYGQAEGTLSGPSDPRMYGQAAGTLSEPAGPRCVTPAPQEQGGFQTPQGYSPVLAPPPTQRPRPNEGANISNVAGVQRPVFRGGRGGRGGSRRC